MVKPEYHEAVGRRKTSVARVRLRPSTKPDFSINDRALATYLPTAELQRLASVPLGLIGETLPKLIITVRVNGGGINSQAKAVAHGLARALISLEPAWRSVLKKAGELTRDSRMKERRKFGLKKARKAPQWSKR